MNTIPSKSKKKSLPKNLRGKWIWKEESSNEIESYAFFRREFTLNETPHSTNLWITACTFFHLFVNGRHFCYGPAPAVGNQCYLLDHDIGYYLETGKNVLSILAYNTTVSRSTQTKRDHGFWCQLDIDSTPLLWTDEDWLTYTKECYRKNQPRVSRSCGFVETLDMRKYPTDWLETNCDTSKSWKQASEVASFSQNAPEFISHFDFEPLSERIPIDTFIGKGNIVKEKFVTHVNFSKVLRQKGGLYAAESFLQFSEKHENIALSIISDDPFYLFINDQLIKKVGGEDQKNWTDASTPICYRQDLAFESQGNYTQTISLQKGWNTFLLVQQADRYSAGTSFILPYIEAEEMKFIREKSSFGLPGWNIAGPLRIPFSHVASPPLLHHFKLSSYYGGIHPYDVAAHLMGYIYELDEEEDTSVDILEITKGEFVLLELQEYQRGCLECLLSGTSGDTIDIIYGDAVTGDSLSPIFSGVRRVFTIILKGGLTKWQAVTPHGMRYLMIVARQVTDTVMIQDMGIRKTALSMKNQNYFACSDELLNQIWAYGINTLNATYEGRFLDSGDNPQGQKLADAMIQGIVSYFVYGHKEFSEQGLREFAQAQFETGEIPSITPGDFGVRYYDFGLLWPIWLQLHVLHTGDKELLYELLPNLESLLYFFEKIASPYSGLIGNQEGEGDVPFLIDYDNNLDRQGISTALNALYCCSLLKSEWLFSLAGKEEKAKECNHKASRIALQLRELTWNEEKGFFADAWYQGKMSNQYSLQTNVLALYAGLLDGEQVEKIFRTLFFDYAPYCNSIVDKQNENPYFKFFLLDMVFTLDLREWGIEYLQYYWGKMVQQGATTWWDKFSPELNSDKIKAQSLCQGYAVSPNYFLIREVAGIRIADSSGSKIFFQPILTACEWVQAKIQTSQGSIKVEWGYQESGKLKIYIDSDFPLEVVPLCHSPASEGIELHVSDDVHIVKS